MMDPASITWRVHSIALCRVPDRCDDRPAARPKHGGIQQHTTTLHAHAHHLDQNHQLPSSSTARDRFRYLHLALRAVSRKHLHQDHRHRCCATAPAETPSPPPDTTKTTMASSTGNNGWAQLRQQARSLESQVSSHSNALSGGCS